LASLLNGAEISELRRDLLRLLSNLLSQLVPPVGARSRLVSSWERQQRANGRAHRFSCALMASEKS
jgi:hypothetical protein